MNDYAMREYLTTGLYNLERAKTGDYRGNAQAAQADALIGIGYILACIALKLDAQGLIPEDVIP